MTEENILAFLGEGTERSEADGVVTYTRVDEARDSEDFSGALQKLGFEGVDGPPVIRVDERGSGDYRVTLALGMNSAMYGKLGADASWRIHGEGLRPTAVIEDEFGTAVLGEETITVEGQHGVVLVFAAERAGLGPVAIAAILIVLALGGLVVAVGIVAFLHRGRLKALFAHAQGAPAAAGAPTGPEVDGQDDPGPPPAGSERP